jgi:hypothetical protein
MSKMSIKCDGFKSFRKNTIYGFCEITISEIGLRIKDLTIHEKNGSRWAALPAKPMLKDGVIVKDADGKGQYVNILEFSSREVRDAFSRSVVNAVLEHTPGAFAEDTASGADTRPAVSDRDKRVRGAADRDFSDEIPF